MKGKGKGKHLRFSKAHSSRRIIVKGGVGHPATLGSKGQSKKGKRKRSRKR
jgi:hypothetical protein